MKLPVYAIMVVYNRSLEDCPTYHTLRKSSGVTTFVCDNSTKEYSNAAQAARYGMRYLSMGGNVGLPTAYNRALDVITGEATENALICIFDDDTEFSPDYFDALQKAAQEHPDADGFFPMVYDKLGLMSPCRKKGAHMHRCTETELANLPQQKLYAINSGMALRYTAVAQNRYDQAYFLDYVDFAFLRTLKEKGATFATFPYSMRQNFSGSTPQSHARQKQRFSIFKKDFRRFCADSLAHRVEGELCLLYRRVKMMFRK